jgi:neutral trehalase
MPSKFLLRYWHIFKLWRNNQTFLNSASSLFFNISEFRWISETYFSKAFQIHKFWKNIEKFCHSNEILKLIWHTSTLDNLNSCFLKILVIERILNSVNFNYILKTWIKHTTTTYLVNVTGTPLYHSPTFAGQSLWSM